MKQVYIAQSPADAYLLKGFLDANEITAFVQGESLFNARGGIPLSPGTEPSVWVADIDFDQALEMINAFFQVGSGGDAQLTAWSCPTCAEYLEGQFTDCWNCGTSRWNEE